MKTRISGIFMLLLLCFSYGIRGNNLQINNLQVNANHTLGFDISWENSWALDSNTAPGNHDAVWIFLKYHDNDGTWKHLDLSAQAADHNSDSLQIETVTDGKGVYLKRKSNGSGNIAAHVTLAWTTKWLNGNFDFKIFGIEMAWVNEGAFYAGDGGSYNSLRRGDKNLPYFIRSEDAISVGNDSMSILDTGKTVPEGSIPAAYPKGYHGFYAMKYEITQEQYADFLNTLTYTQQKAHISVSPDAAPGTFVFAPVRANRNGIIISTSGKSDYLPAIFGCDVSGDNVINGSADGQNRACNFLNWNDLAAYLQWAALRPMTELEFEKICRGPVYPVAREFAWGTAYGLDANTTVNDGTAQEQVKESPGKDTGLASFGYAGLQGPLRAGFAAKSNTNRLQAGAGYYGNMEMSGDLWEICVVLTPKGLSYTGTTGDGNLAADGYANIVGWPGKDCSGAGQRGGGWNSGVATPPFRDPAVSDRFYVKLLPTDRRNTTGGRGVR